MLLVTPPTPLPPLAAPLLPTKIAMVPVPLDPPAPDLIVLPKFKVPVDPPVSESNLMVWVWLLVIVKLIAVFGETDCPAF